jgi:hypothetical protein
MSYPLSRIVIATENRLKVFREERIWLRLTRLRKDTAII